MEKRRVIITGINVMLPSRDGKVQCEIWIRNSAFEASLKCVIIREYNEPNV